MVCPSVAALSKSSGTSILRTSNSSIVTVVQIKSEEGEVYDAGTLEKLCNIQHTSDADNS